ncbi:hypothetical protein PtA15_2A902 [Puccinia triticina]|nr:uncharacterized protein PtA15_2A902 [Puccinia triticina]WAQ82585.1 hypothetical protein PtA15_2A902 [Puccinia triticina]
MLLAIKAATTAPLAFQNSSTGPQPFQEKPCFMGGPFNVPKDVVINLRVICLDGPQPFQDVPNVFFERWKYSDYDFQKFPNLSPVAFALKYFTPPDRSAQSTNVLEGLMAIYGATNAGLRSWGAQKSNDVKKIKGPSFYLAFQHAISVNDLKRAAHQLGKVLKNCVGCKKEEREQVIKIATDNHVEVPKSF